MTHINLFVLEHDSLSWLEGTIYKIHLYVIYNYNQLWDHFSKAVDTAYNKELEYKLSDAVSMVSVYRLQYLASGEYDRQHDTDVLISTTQLDAASNN